MSKALFSLETKRPRWRRRLLLAAGAILLPLVAMVGAVAVAPFPAVRAEAGTQSVMGFYHVHTTDSHDGYGTLEEAALAAKGLGASFLILTEHNLLAPEAPKVVEGVLIVPGVEISAEAGHVAAVGLGALPEERGADVLAAIEREGGAAILAHPINLRNSWDDPSPTGFVGFEALSLDSAFREAVGAHRLRLGLPLFALPGDRRKLAALLMHRPAEALARYDELTADRPVAMMCGVDAHGLPAYRSSFAALAQHIALEEGQTFGEDPKADAALVVESIRGSRTFCSIPALGDASSFSLRVEGDRVVAAVGTGEATLRLFHGGREVASGEGPRLEAHAQPGPWRAEVWVSPGFPWGRDRLWIASSAIHLPLTVIPGGA